MSLLLDALRKSERQRNLGTAPSIHLPPSNISTHRNKSSSRYIIYIFILLALLVVWMWILFRGENNLLDNNPVKPPIDTSVSTSPISGVSTQGIDETGSAIDDFSVPAPINNRPFTAEISPKIKAESENINTALDINKPSQPIVAEQALAEVDATIEAEKKRREKLDAERLLNLKQRLADQQANRHDEEESIDESVRESSGNRQQAQTLPTLSEEPVDDFQPSAPQTLSYFDLPTNIRQKIPKLSRSLQVYDTDPQKRFVVINQQRLFEGDKIDDITLVEVRRNSVILDYQAYRFEYQ